MALLVLSTHSFDRLAKKLHSKDKKILDSVITRIANDPSVGEEKRGDLNGVFVYKFKLNSQETSLAYGLQPHKLKPSTVLLLAVGPHENFYTHLKRAP